MLRATVSGSFHRHMPAIEAAVSDLRELGVGVLSPSDPRIVDQHGAFLYVASDKVRSIRLVQDRHLEAIRASHFLWLVAPDGYVGQSASMEIGFAVGSRTPIFSASQPNDLTLRRYVTTVSGLPKAITLATRTETNLPPRAPGLLINPEAAIDEAHDHLQIIEDVLHQPASDVNDVAARKVYTHRSHVARLIAP